MRESQRGVRETSQRRQDKKRDSESEEETAGTCREGEMSRKPLKLELQTATSAPDDPWIKQQKEPRQQTVLSEKGEREH